MFYFTCDRSLSASTHRASIRAYNNHVCDVDSGDIGIISVYLASADDTVSVDRVVISFVYNRPKSHQTTIELR